MVKPWAALKWKSVCGLLCQAGAAVLQLSERCQLSEHSAPLLCFGGNPDTQQWCLTESVERVCVDFGSGLQYGKGEAFLSIHGSRGHLHKHA